MAILARYKKDLYGENVPIVPECGEPASMCLHSTPCKHRRHSSGMSYAYLYSLGYQPKDVSALCDVCNGCKFCCSCVVCSGCKTKVDSQNGAKYCKTGCGRCVKCCMCKTCATDGCTVRSPNANAFCPPHGRCDKHALYCCARHAGYLENEGQPPTFHTGQFKQFRENRNHRFIAAEIEVASGFKWNSDTVDIARRWGGNLVYDGSIVPKGDTFEINSAPANGDLFLQQIREYCKSLEPIQAYVNNTCGLHVHVDARDFTWYDLRRLILLYEKLEPALFSMVQTNRRNNEFCRPCGPKYASGVELGASKSESKHLLMETIYGIYIPDINTRSVMADQRAKAKIDAARLTLRRDGYTKSQMENHMQQYVTAYMNEAKASKGLAKQKNHKREQAHYNALNLHSWFYNNRGTIECRLHHGTLNADEITNWGMLWAEIVDFAYKQSESTIAALAPDIHLCRAACLHNGAHRAATTNLAHSQNLMREVLPSHLHQYMENQIAKHN